jgi:hypothetical protein
MMKMENNKQFLIAVDELGCALLAKLVPGMRFIEVIGVPVENPEVNYVVLANPKPLPDVPPVVAEEAAPEVKE